MARKVSDIDPGGEHSWDMPIQPDLFPDDDLEVAHYREKQRAQFDVFAQVRADLKARDEKGWKEHGVALDARFKLTEDWLQEAYEEALDKVVYLKAALIMLKERANGR